MKRLILLVIPLVFFSCKPQENTKQQDKLIQSVLWYQHSGEMKALYYQGYNLAGSIISAYNNEASELPPAVVLDIDETILDNSPQSVQQILDNQSFNDEAWDKWCRLAEAQPLPGALEFTLKAKELGIEVFYITNRKAHLTDVTLENLRKFGFPNADSTHLYPREEGSSSSKNGRRAIVSENYRIILFMGDNLGDFDGMFDDRSVNEGCDAVEAAKDAFGTRFIVFPNPIYGNWERAALSGPDGTRLDALSVLKGYSAQNE